MTSTEIMSGIRISVVVPTYHRVELLRRNLWALVHQTLSSDLYEVIVAHQESGDGTGEMVQAFARKHPFIRYLTEPRQGVAHARNAGLYAARGEIVVCTDDDAFAPPHWLETILRVFDEVRPAPHVVGGPILPLVIGRRPYWFRDEYEIRSWGDTARLVAPGERRFPTGNVAYRRDLLLAVGGFDPTLGMKGQVMGFAEDDEVYDRLRQSLDGEFRAYFEPQAYVWHAVPDEKMRPGYPLKRAFVGGQTSWQLDRRKPRPERLAALRYQTASLAWGSARALLAMSKAPHVGDWLVTRVAPCARRLGYVAAALGIRVKARRSH